MQLSIVQLRRSPWHLFLFRSSGNHSQRNLQHLSKHSWSRQGLKHKMARHGQQKKCLYHCIFLQKLSQRRTKVAEETKEPSVAYGEGSDCIGSKASHLLTFPHGNTASKKLYTEDRRVYRYRAQKKKAWWRRWNTVQKRSCGVLDLDGHQIRN